MGNRKQRRCETFRPAAGLINGTTCAGRLKPAIFLTRRESFSQDGNWRAPAANAAGQARVTFPFMSILAGRFSCRFFICGETGVL
jgi:hypothetical protein